MMSAKDFLFTESHEWIDLSGGDARVGISDHAQQLMGDIVFVELPTVGKVVQKGEEILTIESPKAAASVYAPLSGEIIAVNERLESAPEVINQSPYGDGWIVVIKPGALDAEKGALLDADAYEKKVQEA